MLIPVAVGLSEVADASELLNGAGNRSQRYPTGNGVYVDKLCIWYGAHLQYIEGLSLPTALQTKNPSASKTATREPKTTVGATQVHHSSRVKPSMAPLGSMERTYVEGMSLPFSYQTKYTSSNTKIQGLVPASQYQQEKEGKSYPAHTTMGSSFKSRPPSNAKNFLSTLDDQTFASKQTRINTLPPDERRKQESWAQTMIQKAGVCPSGFDWRRVTDGYHCNGRGTHFISDDLLAEGRGGVFYVPAGLHGRLQPKWGPYYEDPNDPIPGSLIYGGDPSVACPEGMRDGCAVWPKI